MKDFVEGLILAVENRIISIQLAKAYINAYIGEHFGVNFSDEVLKRLK